MTATDSPAADPSTNGGSQRRGFGVDVGGSGVKGGIVDLDTGQLIGERFKIATPHPATPDPVSKPVAAAGAAGLVLVLALAIYVATRPPESGTETPPVDPPGTESPAIPARAACGRRTART